MFLEYMKNNCSMNLNSINKVKFNKKSISVTIDKDMYNFFFNDLFTEQSLLKMILKYYSNYKNLDYDYLSYKYKKINISLI